MACGFDKQTLETLSSSPFVRCDDVEILRKGEDTFRTIFSLLESARSIICLQFYIFRNDESGREMAEILKRKARNGVAVYLLYDHFGSFGTPRTFWKDMEEAGVSIGASRPFRWLSPLRYAHRDHRKLIIVDGTKAITGSLNIANEYWGFHRHARHWRDTGVLVEGPIAGELFRMFRTAWKTWKRIDILPGEKTDAGAALSAPSGGSPVPAMPIFASSSKGRRRMRKLLYYSIEHSQESLCLTTAYFTPSRRLILLLSEAVRRGVVVALLLPGQSDMAAAQYAGRASFAKLLAAGVKIHLYSGEMLHAKSYVFDRCWSIVGSANLDFQSLRRNDEGNVGILSPLFGERMSEMFSDDLGQAVELTAGEWEDRPFGEKVLERLCALFRRRL
jgi:cardiolipin synthase